MCKVQDEFAPIITANVFFIFFQMSNNHSNLRNYSDFIVLFARNNYHRIESISHIGYGILFL